MRLYVFINKRLLVCKSYKGKTLESMWNVGDGLLQNTVKIFYFVDV